MADEYKTVVFVDGCFRHGHEGCKYFHLAEIQCGILET